MIYLKLFWSFFQIGLFSFGGGYAALPLIQKQVVDINGWLNISEFTDVVTISQMTPGPIALNAASFVGIKISGILGAIIATAGCVAPSCIIVLILAYFYYKYKELGIMKNILFGLRPAVVSLIASAGITILILAIFNGNNISFKNIDIIAGITFLGGVVILRKWKINPIFIMIGAGILGIIFYGL